MSRKAGLWGFGLICRLSMSDLDTVSNPDRNPLFLSISFVFSLFLLFFVIKNILNDIFYGGSYANY
jgi:hypothetical protein